MPSICFRCKREVHAAEEKLALGTTWHVECFTCACCNQSLDSTNTYESGVGQEIYCRKCYKQYYCIPGYGFGPTKPTLLSVPLDQDTTKVSETECPCSPCDCDPNDQSVPDEIFVPAPSRQGQEYTPRRLVPRHYTKQVVVPTQTTKPKCSCDKAQDVLKNPTLPRLPQPYYMSYLQKNEECQRGRLREEPVKGATPCYCPPPTPMPQKARPTPPPQPMPQKCRCPIPPPPMPQDCRRDSPAPWTSPAPKSSNSNTRGSSNPPPQRGSSNPPPQRGSSNPPPPTRASSVCKGPKHPFKPRSRPKSVTREVPICQRCGKEVYFAEQVMGYRGVFHIHCFVCYCCGKSLDATTVNYNEGRLYCKGCYKQKYATVGVGYGVGAGTLQTR